MRDSPNGPSPVMKVEDLAAIAVEQWRLSRWLDQFPSGPATALPRHALGKMADILRKAEVEIVSMDGHPFEPGLNVRVLDVVDSNDLPEGAAVILETLSPQVTCAGAVVRPAEVVTLRGTRPV